MRLETIKSPGLAQHSYYISDRGMAAVIDPRRDCLIYTNLAKEDCANIKYIFETHRNEDFVIGSIELQKYTGAEIAHSKETPFTYGDHNLDDTEEFQIGQLKLQTIYTPGHTNDSICYILYENMVSDIPVSVFTGDTLFIGDVGRTDLPGLDIWREQTEKLYYSLHEKVLPLGDHVTIYPGHGAGSICGHDISERDVSTLGYEHKTNPLLTLSKEAFITQIMTRTLYRPPYFRTMEVYNLHGPPLLKGDPRPLNFSQFEAQMQAPDTVIVDTREQDAFAAAHIPGSLSIWLNGLSFYPGWVLTYPQNILLVTERAEDVDQAKRYLWRLGFDNIIGYLCPEMNGWITSGRPIEKIKTLAAGELRERLVDGEVTLLDVREETEWMDGHIEEAEHIYVGHLLEKADQLSRDKVYATTCSVGNRGSMGASILQIKGFDVYTVLGGMNAWNRQGYPITES